MAREDDRPAPTEKSAMKSEMTLDVVADKAAAIEALTELYKLLEDYGPIWYREKMHHRAEAALRFLRESHE